jgi:hypothetical protein
MITTKFKREFERGGLVFWIVCTLGTIGFYGVLWVMMALGVMLT